MLTELELKNVNAGSVNWTIAGIAGTIVTFIIGIVDGYLRPLKCN